MIDRRTKAHVNPPSSKDTKPHRRVTHNDAIAIPRKVGEVMFCCTAPEAYKGGSVSTNNSKATRC